MINSNPISIEDLPIRIQKQDDWISFLPYNQEINGRIEILKLKGARNVGKAPATYLSLEDARLELKHYLRDGWAIKNDSDLPVASNFKKRDIKGGLSVDADGKVTNVKR